MFRNAMTMGEKPYSNEDAEWDTFVTTHPHGSFLQLTNWGRLKGDYGWTPRRVWVKNGGKIVAGAQILFKSAALGTLRIAYIPHGPLVDWNDRELVSVLMNQIDWAIYERRAGLVKIEPLLWQDETPAWDTICQQNGWIQKTDTIQPPRTMLLDITPSEDEILARMKSKTRYNIRLSGRKDVVVREGTVADFPAFDRLMQTTGTRNQFGVHGNNYYRRVYELFKERDEVALFLVEYEGRPLAGVLVVTCGKQAVYLAGGSSNEERNRMPAYGVQWAAIQWAKARGCTMYDMWGVPDEDEETLEAQFEERNDGLWGVYRFKRGWGGDVVRSVGCTDKVYNKLLYRLYKRRRP